MPQRINMCLTATNNRANNRANNRINVSSIPPQPITTNIHRVNVSRFNMSSVFISKGRSGG